MKKIRIPYIDSHGKGLNEISCEMEDLSYQPISCNPWPEFITDAKAGFIIAHNDDAILLKYKITEKSLLAREVSNGNIHKDSCVEFFIAFNDEQAYYNLEFNCLGAAKVAFGTDRKNRTLLPLSVLEHLRFTSRICSNGIAGNTGFDWEMMLVIPKETFVHHQVSSLKQLMAKGNFYKCGDSLPEPHFLSWNMVNASRPDFHRIESFGLLEFVDEGT